MMLWFSSALPTEDEWVPLELSFGMPLFSSELNRRVCQKIASHKLCGKDRYKPTRKYRFLNHRAEQGIQNRESENIM